uniref:B-cell receptor CD22 n=1 Tax=Dicentrarchus labrax TaxID=13489 RepID=A0A8P4G8S9_DICLA
MRGAAMSLSAAASGFVVFLLSVSVVQSQNGWGVTYTSTEICALKGSTVDISCTYIYPSRINDHDTEVEESFWFTKMNGNEFVDLRTDSEYSGRVQYICGNNDCTLRITDLRESDSAEYKFRFITNQHNGKYTGSPGVTLSVTDLQVQVSRSQVYESYDWAELKCHSSCRRPDHLHYVWYKNGQKTWRGTSSYSVSVYPADSYSCAVEGYEKSPSPPVYASRVATVSLSPSGEIVEGSSVTLSCTRYVPATTYTWYKKIGNRHLQPPSKEPQFVFRSIQSSDSGEYYCTTGLGRTSEYISINVKYAPRVSSVSVSPSGEIVEGSSVTLTCSSDANPAATYTWYKKNGNRYLQPLSKEPQLVFRSIQSSDSGEYYCTAVNKLGRTYNYISINVKYASRVPSVSVSPSGEIVEGSSVNLTCSSDANPAANYTWYKKNQTLFQGPEGIHHFTSISSEDRGIYHCKSENQYGQIMSPPLSVDVQYAPRVPSVSVSPSGEIVEGSSVTLTCSSDANPAANYTWYKEDEDSPKASGQNFTITYVRPEHSGNYYCEAQNRRGCHNSTLHLTVVAGAGGKLAAAGTITVVLLAIISLSVFLWIRKKRASKEPSDPEERADNREQLRIGQPEEQEDLQYASVHFSTKQADPLYSNIRAGRPLRHMEQQEVIEYAAVSFNRASTAPRTRGQETREDPAALYSTVNRT